MKNLKRKIRRKKRTMTTHNGETSGVKMTCKKNGETNIKFTCDEKLTNKEWNFTQAKIKSLTFQRNIATLLMVLFFLIAII